MEIKLFSNIGELDHPNHNGRIYNSDMMENAINKWKNDGNKMVELAPDYEQFDHFSLENTVGSVKDIWIENGNVFGKVQLFDTPCGKIAKEMINNGEEFVMSPRMTGEVKPVYKTDEEGNPIIGDDGKPIQEIDKNGIPITEITDVDFISCDIIPKSMSLY